MKTLIFFLALLKTSIRSSISVRGAFLIECVLMLGNNLIFILMWWLFFRQFKTIGGWTFNDMIALNAIGMGAYGLMQITAGGIKNLSRMILSGDLDPFMTQPKNILLQIASSKSYSKGWGYLITTTFLMFMGGLTTLKAVSLIVLCMVCGSLVFTSMGIIAHSLAFWIGPIESVSKKYCDSLFLFALYPTNIYSGVLEMMMFTVIPAGFIGYLPVELLKQFSFLNLALLIFGTASFLALSVFIFNLGLRRYESGNQFGFRL